jgi:hypothetical protein
MILPFSGTMMFLHYEKGRAKRHIIEVLKKKEKGEVINLTLQQYEFSSLRWEHEYEFEYKSEMYDLVSKETKDGVIVLQCIHDKKETSINKSIVKFIAGFLKSNPYHDQQLLAISDFTKQLAPITYITPKVISTFIELYNENVESKSLLFAHTDPFIPPPKYS